MGEKHVEHFGSDSRAGGNAYVIFVELFSS